MAMGLIGRKCGMTRIFTETGESIPVTVINVEPNRVVQLKDVKPDGYRSVQVTMGRKSINRLNKPIAGHFAKAGVAPGVVIKEFRLDNIPAEQEFKLGEEITVNLFKEGQKVNIRALTKGKGFAGAIKRHHFSMQDATHGNSVSHRALGSTGQCQSPGRVFKGKKMAGQLGNVYRTAENQKIIKVDTERNLLLIKGAIPGAPGGEVVITNSVKDKARGVD